MQENSGELKQEVRQLLATHGISQFTMKPVRRSYAFEDAAIPHGQHWVLKVKYPATGSRLPLGLKGMLASCQLMSHLRMGTKRLIVGCPTPGLPIDAPLVASTFWSSICPSDCMVGDRSPAVHVLLSVMSCAASGICSTICARHLTAPCESRCQIRRLGLELEISALASAGDYFAAVLGTNQSALEMLLLKRRVRGTGLARAQAPIPHQP